MSTYEPGTVAVAKTVNKETAGRLGSYVRVCRTQNGWAVLDDAPNDFFIDGEHDDCLEILRPLVVLDLAEIGWGAASLVKWLREIADYYVTYQGPGNPEKARLLADQIEAQMPKPRRITEPLTIGAVVRAAQVGEVEGSERPWTKFRPGGWIDTLDHIREWSDLDAPVLIRDGIQDAP